MVFIVDMPVPPEAAVNQPKNGYSPPCNLLLGFVGVDIFLVTIPYSTCVSIYSADVFEDYDEDHLALT